MKCEIRAKREGPMRTKRSRKPSKRTVIQPRKGDRRYVRRNKAGQFKKEVNAGRSLAADRRRKAETKVAKGQGDRGDTKPSGNVVRRLVQNLSRGYDPVFGLSVSSRRARTANIRGQAGYCVASRALRRGA